MIANPPALAEGERLATLHSYDILDTPPEAEFDDFTKLAAQICGTPIALISLIDAARQWFKSKVGVEATETPRNLSFCAHAIAGSELFEVPNASLDPRFREHPLVKSCELSFYAGAPLVAPNGHKLGTLCVIDPVSRQLTPEQRDALMRLARQVVNLLELRRATRTVQELNANLGTLVSERTRALAESERRHRTLLSNLKGMVYRCRNDRNWTAEFVSEGSRSVLGYTPEEITSGTIVFNEVIHPEDRQHVWDTVQAAIASNAPFSIEYRIKHASGTWRWVWENGMVARGDSEGAIWLESFISDVTARKEEEEQLRLSEFSINCSSLATYWSNPEGLILRANEAACKLLGYSEIEMREMRVSDLVTHFGPNDWQAFLQKLRKERSISLEAEMQVKDGRSFSAELETSWMEYQQEEYVFTFVKDITERKQAERQNLRTQRLESIGTLAGGLAHDLNNALAPILIGLEMLRADSPNGSSMIDIMETSAQRGAEMVRQLLTFAKGAEGDRALLDSRRLVQEISKIITSTFPKSIQVRTDYSKEMWNVVGDYTQLHQVLLNLSVNARDAMPNGGVLTLEVENTQIDAEYARSVPEAKPGFYLLVRVRDTGTGMSPDVLDRIFEPFFSTKPPDKGTGLGLSTVAGIVRSHNGFVHVSSTVGQGSTFEVYLPADPSGARPERAQKIDSGLKGEGETVLVVDDEEAVRHVTRAVLTQLKFKVLAAADGTEALMQVSEYRSRLRVIITDLDMPHIDGLTLVRVLKHMVPNTPVIVSSGRLEPREQDELQALGVQAILQKPFSKEKLVNTLASVMKAPMHDDSR